MESKLRLNAAWHRLQCLSCEHSARLYAAGRTRRLFNRGVNVEEIKENCEILGRGDEEEIKERVFWYITFQPHVFEACVRNGWKY